MGWCVCVCFHGAKWVERLKGKEKGKNYATANKRKNFSFRIYPETIDFIYIYIHAENTLMNFMQRYNRSKRGQVKNTPSSSDKRFIFGS